MDCGSLTARKYLCRYSKLSWLKRANIIAFNSALVKIFTFLRIAPSGIKDVHDMLVNVAQSLISGGETGLFPILTSLRRALNFAAVVLPD